jgi:hypothetical protein
MHYTTVPMADPNLVHDGFFAISVALAVVVTVAWVLSYVLDKTDLLLNKGTYAKWTVGICAALLLFPFYHSFVKYFPAPKNEPVEAVRVDVHEAKTSGKYPTMASNVLYETPDGVISFPMGSGFAWPSKVILYRQHP